MKFQPKVIKWPMDEIWNADGVVSTHRLRDLGCEEIRSLLRRGVVRFVRINIGHIPEWIPLSQCYTVWKTEILDHLVEPAHAEHGFALEDFPDEYCYTASEWASPFSEPAVLLFMHH